jgi:NTE family protein
MARIQKKEKKKHQPKVKAGVAFGGGGARGFAHIGVMRAFEENGVDFQYVAGTSVGSMIGAFYADGYTSKQLEDIAFKIKHRDIINSRLIFIPSQAENIEKVMKAYIGDIKFEDLKKPFGLAAVDVKSGNEVNITQGDLAKAVSASCAVPLFFTPVEWEDYLLYDGGLLNNVPSDVVRYLGAEVVVGIDINSTKTYGTDSKRTFDLVAAALRIAMKSTANQGIINADIVIQPDVSKYRPTRLRGGKDMIEIGYEAAMEKMGEIKAMLKIK